MKISIWQQWASNHSGHFTVVGVCQSPERAQATATQLEQLLQVLFQWYADHPQAGRLDMYDPPPPPEQALIEQFDLQIPGNLGLAPLAKVTSVRAVDRVVLLHIAQTWYHPGHEALRTLVERLGSQAAGIDTPLQGVALHVALSARAPDEATARRVRHEMVAALANAEPQGDALMVRIELPWRADVYVYQLAVRQEGQTLSIAGFFDFLHRDLPALIRYLQEQGFTDFDLQLREEML